MLAQLCRLWFSDPRVRIVNFTGSTKVGRIIATEAAQNLKPSIMELGGKNALIILKDADIEYAVKAAVHGAYMNSGQICMSTDRVISENLKEAMDVAGKVSTGIVHINDQGIGDEPMAPFGGVKNTGFGRFGGQAGLDAFTTMRWITVQERGHTKY
jgi:acyl-CoA reductase-like NAD-dependent aldehyde dehydrogenase